MDNGKNTIDDQIRAALEHFEQPYNAEHWQAMTAQLTALDAADAAFDTSLRDRLVDISALPKADAWSIMADKLDDLEAADASFDTSLRGRLADVSGLPKMGDWSKMAAALDSFDDTESEFDDVLRRKLENIAGNYPNHWAMMNERLDREFTLRGKIVRYKIVETALMLLFLFTVINAIDWNTYGSELKIQNETLNDVSPNTSESDTKKQAEKATPSTLKTTPSNTVKSLNNATNWRERGGIQYKNGQNKGQNEQNTRQNQPVNQKAVVTPSGQPIVDNSINKAILPSNADILNQNAPNTDLSREHREGGNFQKNAAQNVDIAIVPNTFSSKNEGKEENNSAIAANKSSVDVVPAIDILQANLLKNNKLEDDVLTIVKPNTEKKAKWRFSAFGTAALDKVTTSFVNVDRKQYFQEQRVPNYGVNALVSYQRGKVELETGLMINQKKYSIANAKTITGSFSRSYEVKDPDKLRLSIVSIPLNVNVKVKDTRRWNAYLHSGVVANAIVDAFDYGLKSKTVDATNSSAPPPPSEVETAEYSKGLLNGGETKENVFLTAHLGAGIEYKLTPKTSLFMQPTASFMLNKKRGIGDLNDRVKTYSIQGGAKWRL